MVNKVSVLKKEQDILAEPAKNLGEALNEETVQTVKAFYEDNDFAGMCPGKKEYVSVKTTDSRRIHRQKRLLLVNLKQLYLEFKSQHLSLKICSLWPPWHITVDSRGMCSVCVCARARACVGVCVWVGVCVCVRYIYICIAN
jgi:hypothetical protein